MALFAVVSGGVVRCSPTIVHPLRGTIQTSQLRSVHVEQCMKRSHYSHSILSCYPFMLSKISCSSCLTPDFPVLFDQFDCRLSITRNAVHDPIARTVLTPSLRASSTSEPAPCALYTYYGPSLPSSTLERPVRRDAARCHPSKTPSTSFRPSSRRD